MFTVPVPGLGIEIIRRQQRMWTMEAEKDPKKEKMNPFEDKKECCHLEGSFFFAKVPLSTNCPFTFRIPRQCKIVFS